MEAVASRFLGGDEDVRIVEVDLSWMETLASKFEDTILESTAEQAITKLAPLGIDITQALTALEIYRLSGGIPLDVPEELGLVIHSYTVATPSLLSGLSRLFNHPTERATQTTQLDAAMPWLKMLDVAISKLSAPYVYMGTAYRGIRYAFPNLEIDFCEGKTICWYTFKSVATERTLMRDSKYCGDQAGPRTVYILKEVHGKRIKTWSACPEEEEVLLRPMVFFQVLGVRRGDYGAGDPFDGHADIIELKMLDWWPPRSTRDVLVLLQHDCIQANLRLKHGRMKANARTITPASATDPYFHSITYQETLNELSSERAQLRCQDAFQQLVTCSPLCISFSDDKTLKVWNLAKGVCEQTLSGHSNWVTGVALWGSDKCISCSADNTLKIWNLATGACEQTLSGNSLSITGVVLWGSDKCVSCSDDNTLRIVNLVTGVCERTLSGHSHYIRSIVLWGCDRCISCSADNTLKVWNLAAGVCEQTLSGHFDWVTGVALWGSDQCISCSNDKTLKVWDLDTGVCEQTLSGHSNCVTGVVLWGSDKCISCSDDTTLKVWNLAAGICEQTLSGHSRYVKSIVLWGSDKCISCSADMTLKVWNLITGAFESTLSGHSDWVTGVALWDMYFPKVNLDTRVREQTWSGHWYSVRGALF